jgi:hypothetical protein
MKTVEEFNKNYETLGDAVVKNVSIIYMDNPAQLVIKVVLDCMATIKDYEWVYLEISFYGVEEFKILSLPNISIQVVESFAIDYLDDLVIFNFSPNVIPPENITEHRDSLFYIICKDFSFKELS